MNHSPEPSSHKGKKRARSSSFDLAATNSDSGPSAPAGRHRQGGRSNGLNDDPATDHQEPRPKAEPLPSFKKARLIDRELKGDELKLHSLVRDARKARAAFMKAVKNKHRAMRNARQAGEACVLAQGKAENADLDIEEIIATFDRANVVTYNLSQAARAME